MDMTRDTNNITELRQLNWKGAAQRVLHNVLAMPLAPIGNETEVVVKITALAYYMLKEDVRGWRCNTAVEDRVDIEKLQALIQHSTLDDDIKQELLPFAVTYWNQIWNCSHSYSICLNKAVALCWTSMKDVESMTDPVISELAKRLLELQQGEVVADVCSGYGSFLVDAATQQAVSAWGIDINHTANVISRIRNWILQADIEFSVGNVLANQGISKKADKVFSQAPVMMRDEGQLYGETIKPYIQDVPSATKMTWAFIITALQAQKKGGRTVVVVPSNLLAKTTKGEAQIRKDLLLEGKLEAVIKLPARAVLPYSSSVSLLVFSQGNTHVRMIDASQFGKQVRSRTLLSTEDIQEIVALAKNDGKYSCFVTPEEMQGQEYVWVPERYIILPEDQISNGEPLDVLQKKILRGHTIGTEELENLLTKTVFSVGYVILQNLDDGQLVSMNYLRELPERYERYVVQEGDLLFSRSMPFKMAVVPPLAGKKVIISGNMYAIRLRQDLVHPVYVMLYLQSPQGERQLQRFSQGSALQSISLIDLKKIQIPMIPLEEQEKIVASYRELQKQLNEVKEQEKILRNEIQQLISQ